jgi:hypothetical protein
VDGRAPVEGLLLARHEERPGQDLVKAGGSAGFEAAGLWFAALSEADWPDDAETRAQIERDWQAPWGDRRHELVFIGVDVDEAALRARLDEALLRDDELAAGPSSWGHLPDPFPPWTLDEAPST